MRPWEERSKAGGEQMIPPYTGGYIVQSQSEIFTFRTYTSLHLHILRTPIFHKNIPLASQLLLHRDTLTPIVISQYHRHSNCIDPSPRTLLIGLLKLRHFPTTKYHSSNVSTQREGVFTHGRNGQKLQRQYPHLCKQSSHAPHVATSLSCILKHTSISVLFLTANLGRSTGTRLPLTPTTRTLRTRRPCGSV